MYCSNCGALLKENANFCTNCGNKITKNEFNQNNVNVNPVINYADGKATASLTIGVISLIFSFVFGILSLPLPIIGLILGINSKGKNGNKTAGIILNVISLVIIIISLIILLFGVEIIKRLINN